MEVSTFDKTKPARNFLTKALRIMKLTVFLLTVLCITAGASGHSQTVTITAKKASLSTIFTEIQKQTGYGFVYRWELLEKARPVDLQVKQAPLKEVLDICFKEQPLSYSIVDNTIIISNKVNEEKVAVTATIPVIDIRGKVTNEKGEAISGATIAVKGNKLLTSTNKDGEFFLAGVEENAVLVISHISFETMEIKTAGNKEIAVQMKMNISELNVVSINTGYQQLKPNEVTGSVATVSQEQLERRVSTDIISKLEGITSGLVFNRSVTGVKDLSIRGRSTISAKDDPLIVVDNFPYEGDVNDINPNDIESITMLKDAAAASIWGVRAGNGVIVITTKKGKFNQALRIVLNTNMTIGEKPDLFYDQNFLNSTDFIDIETFLFSKGAYNADFTATAKTPISPIVEILNKRKLGQITAADSAAQIGAFRELDVRNDLSKYFYQKSINQQYALNISGGTEKVSYYMSAGVDKNLSSLVRNKNERVTLNSLIAFRPFKKIEISGGLTHTQTHTESNNTESQIVTGGKYGSNILPYTQFINAQGGFLPILKDYRAVYADTAGGGRFLNWRYYPINELNSADNTNKSYHTRLNANIKYTVIKGLSIELKYQYEIGITKGLDLKSADTYFTRNLINKYTSIKPGGIIKNNIPVGGILDLSNSNLSSNSGRGQINYTNNWNKSLLSVIAGIETREIRNDRNSERTYGYDPLNITYSNVNFDSTYSNQYPTGSAKIPNNKSFSSTLNRYRSFFANAAYMFYNRYTLSASARIDQSNIFGVKTNQKSVPLWSIGSKWVIDNEKFYSISWLPSLTLRVSYGYNGNTSSSLSAYTIGEYSSSAQFTGASYLSISTPGNPKLRWEKIGIFNIGFDFSTSKNILAGSIEFYRKNGVDIIGESPLPSSTGFLTATGNFSDIAGHGFDIILTSKNINRAFKWETTFLFSQATDKVTKYKGTSVSTIVVGRPVSYVSSFPWAGLDPSTGDPLGYLADTVTKNYTALNLLRPDQQIYNGPSNPSMFGGINNIFSWKGITVSANISYKFGYYFKRKSISNTGLYGSWAGHSDYYLRWQKPGDELFTNVPSFVYPAITARDAFYTNSEILVEKGDHMRLQDVSISYDLNKKQLQQLHLYRLQFYAYANNLGIIWRANSHNIDPDYQSGYPAPRTISLGLRIGL
ncbi:MAG: SusC/RagA family TonB-linked outer membrane protein [Bacteroidota bacterium]